MKIKFDGPRADMIILIYFSLASGAGLSSGADAPPSPSSAPPYCFVKISTGERLIGYDVTRIIDRTTVEACQKECLIYKCTHFSFGTYSKENGTCELTTGRQISRRLDSKFELYEKTDECIEGKPKGYERGFKS